MGGNIENSYAAGDVTSFDGTSIGGLVGFTSGVGYSMTNSFASGNVTGGEKVGGLIGELIGTTKVDNTYATGNVTGTRETDTMRGGGMIGGLIGSSNGGIVSNSHATGNVMVVDNSTVVDGTTGGRTNNVGGLIGNQMYGSVNDSYATGTVVGNGGDNTGGLVGNNYGGTVNDSYYQDSNVVRAAENAPIRAEIGRILEDVRSRESDKSRSDAKGGGTPASRRGTRLSLDQFIYSDDESRYSARVKAISVEDECEDGEDCER
jgi:hypothetical protein